MEIPGSESAINKACKYVEWLHLLCFAALVIATNYVPKKLTTNTNVIKIFLGFVTVPLYVYMILWLESALEDDRIKFESGPPNIKTKGRVCVSKSDGNVRQWAYIEILTFYFNITVMMVYLLQTRFLARGKVMAPPAAAIKDENPLAQAVNQTIVEEVVEEDKKQSKNTQAIEDALHEIDKSSDLLRTID